ncbi:MAG TPA: hypothetical protein VJ160_07835 [Anaerolineales bacterium]|nr:hypothetical protein [Anaerolineales bacterium]
MNPVTRHLLENIDDPDLAEFAVAWDVLEEQVVRIYRAAACPPAEAVAFERGLQSAAASYPRWAEALAPHWRAASVEAALVKEDPFDRILHTGGAKSVIGNGPLIRTLPAAREALNHLLLERAVA